MQIEYLLEVNDLSIGFRMYDQTLAQKTLIVVSEMSMAINKGEIVADGSPDSLQDKFRGQVEINLVLKKDSIDKDLIERALASISNVERARVLKVDDTTITFHVSAKKGSDVREEIFRKIVAMNLVLLEMNKEEKSLEDIFRQLTKNSEKK